VIFLAFSNDGKTLVCPCLSGRLQQGLTLEILRWDVARGTALKTESVEPGGILAMSANGKCLITRSIEDGSIAKAWNLDSGRAVSLEGHSKHVGLATISADGSRVATIGASPVQLIAWDAASGKKLWSHKLDRHKGHGDGGVAFSPNGKALVVAGHRGSLLFDVATGESTSFNAGPAPLDCVKFSPDGKLLAFAGADVKLWSVEKKRVVAVLKTKDEPGTGIPFFSADCRTLVTASTNGHVHIWHLPKLEP
jgi:WD40 repeat protein